MSEQKQIGEFHARLLQALPEMTIGQRQRWIGDPKGLQLFLSGLVEKHLTEQDDIITLTLPPTDGTTGEQWIVRLEKKGYRIGDYAKQILCSFDFKPTTGMVNTVKVLKGELFSDSNRTTKNIHAEAKKRGLINLNAEVACLIRENFTDDEFKVMGLTWIIVMHEPIKDSGGNLKLLGVGRDGDGQWLGSCYDYPGDWWDRGNGFAFSVAQ